MNAIDQTFTALRARNRRALMPFLTAGDPDIGFTVDLLPAVAEAGADLIEVGFPFSDPIADGPTIQASYTRALENGLKLADLFAGLSAVTSKPNFTTPLVGMASYSLVYRQGPDAFLKHAVSAGLSGLIIPDLPAEEADELAARIADAGLKMILLVTPTTPPARAEKIVKLCTGFLYCVSVVGITGERDRLPETLRGQLQSLRAMTNLPLCVGFGVGKPEHVRDLRDVADGVIVGSALVRHLEKPATARESILTAVRSLSAAC